VSNFTCKKNFIFWMDRFAIDSSNRLGNPDQGRQRIMDIQSQPGWAAAFSNEMEESTDLLIPRWKRVLDVTCIIACLPTILPLLALIVVWIRVFSCGQVLFRQNRIGLNGKNFILYKFRSMQINTDPGRHESYIEKLIKSNAPLAKSDCLRDSELIFGGLLLRASGFDELPQLLNVLRGEMSLVGPRPCLPLEYSFYSPEQKERFKVLPGLTGQWQVRHRNCASFAEMNAMDINYVRNTTIFNDIGIIARTPWVLALQTFRALQQLLSYPKFCTDAGMELTNSFRARE
jgi:lipopolysaccharide/colanic/teichoic acid biosynthesis glycosyltransferase